MHRPPTRPAVPRGFARMIPLVTLLLIGVAGIRSAPDAGAIVGAGFNVRVSVNDHGQGGNGASTEARGSADGNVVVFRSDATNLVPNDTNNERDVFVRDLAAGTIERISVSNSGRQGSRTSDSPSISADGRYVVFRSDASEMIDDDLNGWTDIFLRDRLLGTIERVNLNDQEVPATGGTSDCPMISGNGRYVVFSSEATNLAPNDTPGRDLYVRDLAQGTTQRLAVDADCGSYISADGRFVTFGSASPQAAGETDTVHDAYLLDRSLDVIDKVSVNSDEVGGNAWSYNGSVSDNGRWVAFTSDATNLVEGDLNGWQDVFVRDLAQGDTFRVSVNDDEVEGDRWSQGAWISGDGRTVAFTSAASNFFEGDQSGSPDVFVRDIEAATTEWVSHDNAQGQAGGGEGSWLSGDGRLVLFASGGPMVSGDRGNGDVFLQDRDAIPPSDITAPIVTGTLSRPPDAFGWYGAPVTVSWQATDDSGPVASPPDTLVDRYVGQYGPQGMEVESYAACDPDGNCGTGVVTLSLDLTPPYVECAEAPEFAFGQADATVSAYVDDNESGVSEGYRVSVDVDTSQSGSFTVPIVGYDRVGHSTTVDCPYVVNPGPPGKVSGLTASYGDGTVTLTWDPVQPNGSPITGYSIAGSGEAGSQVTQDVDGSTHEVTFADMTRCEPHSFVVTASNAAGQGEASDPLPGVTAAALRSVAVTDTAYQPPSLTAGEGCLRVRFSFAASVSNTRPHSVTDFNKLGPSSQSPLLYNSGAVAPGGPDFTYLFQGASGFTFKPNAPNSYGTYTGGVLIPVVPSPLVVATTEPVEIRWGVRPASWLVFDIDYSFRRAGRTTWSTWSRWRTGQTGTAGSFTPAVVAPRNGAGTYRFRATLRNPVNGRIAAPSPALAQWYVTVT